MKKVEKTTPYQLGGKGGKGFMPGISGNPKGRPVGTFSLKSLIIKRLQENPDQKERIIDELLLNDQGLVLQMIDGRPKQSMDLKGEMSVSVDPEKRLLIENAIDSITAD